MNRPMDIFLPPSAQGQRKYAADILFKDRLGFTTEIQFTEEAEERSWATCRITGQTLSWPNQCPLAAWSGRDTRPELTVFSGANDVPDLPMGGNPVVGVANGWHPLAVEETLPVLWAEPGSEAPLQIGERTEFTFDVLGFCFWYLARVEEVGSTKLDFRDRFEAASSLSFRSGVLDRPVVDETVVLLERLLAREWYNGQELPGRPTFRVIPTHDIDQPFKVGTCSLPRLVGRMGKLMVKRKVRDAVSGVHSWLGVRAGDPTRDPFFRFEEMLSIVEDANLQAKYFFLAGVSHPVFDPGYALDTPVMQHLLARIVAKGHRIGLHASYDSYLDASVIRREREALEAALGDLRGASPIHQNRQHFLRWSSRETPIALEAAGLQEDWSMGFADQPGFRAGTCHPYPLFDWKTLSTGPVVERPLVLMDATLFFPKYLGLDHREAFGLSVALKRRCHQVGGEFVILWHNTFFENAGDREFFSELLGTIH